MTVSLIDLDPGDRLSVGNARQLLARSEQLDHGTASHAELLSDIGRLQTAVDILLRIVDGETAP